MKLILLRRSRHKDCLPSHRERNVITLLYYVHIYLLYKYALDLKYLPARLYEYTQRGIVLTLPDPTRTRPHPRNVSFSMTNGPICMYVYMYSSFPIENAPAGSSNAPTRDDVSGVSRVHHQNSRVNKIFSGTLSAYDFDTISNTYYFDTVPNQFSIFNLFVVIFW